MFRTFAAAREGNVVVMFAMFAPVITIFLAIAIDLGSISVQRRDMQSLTDLAAIVAATDPERAEELALAVLSDNGFTEVEVVKGGLDKQAVDLKRPSAVWVEVLAGQYTPDPDLQPADRFVPGQQPYNAVQVATAQPGRMFVMSGAVAAPVVETSGVAHASGEAAFSVGSRLLRVEGGVLNGLLNSLIGSSLKLEVMDYEALLESDVSLFGTLDALASELSLTAASYDDVLDAEVSLAQLALAARQSGELSAQTRAALNKIAADPASASKMMRLADAIDLGLAGHLGPKDSSKLPEMDVGAMELLTSTLTAANGEHQVTFDLGLSVPGLMNTVVDLKIGERPKSSPWLRLSGAEKIVSTVQTRLKISTEVNGLSALAGTTIRLPVYVEAAAADAKLTRISCPSADLDRLRVNVAAQPAVGEVMIGHVSPSEFAKLGKPLSVKRADLVDTKLIDIAGRADVRIGNLKATDLAFTYADIRDGTIKTATTRDYSASLLASALGELDLSVHTAGLSVGTPKLISQSLASSLAPAVEPVDTIAFNILSALGVHLGEADVRVHGVMCQRAVLVQ